MLITTPSRWAPRFPRVPAASPFPARSRHAALAAGTRPPAATSTRPAPPTQSTRRQAVGCRSNSSSPIGYAQTSATSHATRQRGRHGAAGGRRALSRRLGVQPRPSPLRAGGARYEQTSLAFRRASPSQPPASLYASPPPPELLTPNFPPPPPVLRPDCHRGGFTHRPTTSPAAARAVIPRLPPQPPAPAAAALPNVLPLPGPEGPVPHHDASLS